MISVFTVLLVLVIILCVVLMVLYSRLSAKLAMVEEHRHELDILTRKRIDLLLQIAEKPEDGAPAAVYAQLNRLCEAYLYAELDAVTVERGGRGNTTVSMMPSALAAVMKSHAALTLALVPLRQWADARGADESPVLRERLSALTALDGQIKNAARLYNQAADVYRKNAGVFPGIVIAFIFIPLQPEPVPEPQEE